MGPQGSIRYDLDPFFHNGSRGSYEDRKHPAGIRADKQLRLAETIDREGRAGLAVANYGGTVCRCHGNGVRVGHCGGDGYRVIVVICKNGQAKAAKQCKRA